MGSKLSKLGGDRRNQLLANWKDGVESTWQFHIKQPRLVKRKRHIEEKLQEEQTKRRKLECEVRKLTNTKEQQSKVISRLKAGHLPNSRGPSSKTWEEYSRQHRYKKRRSVAGNIQSALSFCENEKFKPCTIELENIDTRNREILDITNCTFAKKDQPSHDVVSPQSALYVKDKFCISNQAYHELSMLSDLPTSSQVKKLTKTLNSEYEITTSPNNTIGVQQSLKGRIIYRLTELIKQYQQLGKQLPSTVKVKLMGDGTQIARGFSVVNFAFTILEDGQQPCSASGNYTVAILKVSENYDELASALQDIIQEAKDFEIVTVDGKTFKIEYYLGGDWKFLAVVCGLESATCEHSCIWCKCPKGKRWDMSLEWSLTDSNKGARTTDEIAAKSELAKTSKLRFNCCRPPLFSFIPMSRVVIDSLHLFLRFADVLINLLIKDLRTLDGVNKMTDKNGDGRSISKHVDVYVNFLNDNCKIRFRWYVDKETKNIKWRDLTGPEKIRLFKNINIPSLFPDLRTKHKLQQIWEKFFELILILGKENCGNASEFGQRSKEWVKLFTSIYHTKDVTPYIHAFAMHVGEFLKLYGNIVKFSQQGLEKLNDLTTTHFQHSSNHRELEALKQMLQKRNRIEDLESRGFQRPKQIQVCTVCKKSGHNRCTCPSHT